MGNKVTDHNGKEMNKPKGKNIRITEAGWVKIRKYCAKKGLVMGHFVESAAIEKMGTITIIKP